MGKTRSSSNDVKALVRRVKNDRDVQQLGSVWKFSEGARRISRLSLVSYTLVALLISVGTSMAISGCTISSESLEFKRAEKSEAKNDHEEALKHYQNIVDRYVKTPLAMRSAKEAARINHYQLKRPKEAIKFYKHIILYSNSAGERTEAEKKLAALYFAETLDYPQAILEFNRLLELPHSPSDDFSYRLAIARSYFYLSNFHQAQVEVDTILGKGYDKDQIFDALLLKANIFLTSKRLDDAISTLKLLIERYPQRAKTEAIGLVLAITYEEQKNYSKAIETLESIKESYPKKAFLEQRIKILRERQSLLPGARGWKK